MILSACSSGGRERYIYLQYTQQTQHMTHDMSTLAPRSALCLFPLLSSHKKLNLRRKKKDDRDRSKKRGKKKLLLPVQVQLHTVRLEVTDLFWGENSLGKESSLGKERFSANGRKVNLEVFTVLDIK
jgi:hypothetical protein